MRALKALVAVLTLLLLLGVGALIWGVVRQVNKLAEAPAGGTAPAGEVYTPWLHLALDQPEGTQIAGVTNAGDLVIVHLFTGMAGKDERLVVIDPGRGTLLGTVAITGGP